MPAASKMPSVVNPARTLARAKNASLKDLGEATSNGSNGVKASIVESLGSISLNSSARRN